MEITKKCTKCKKEKPLTDFCKNKKSKKDNLNYSCKPCSNASGLRSYHKYKDVGENKIKHLTRGRKSYYNNHDKNLLKNKKFRENNALHVKLYKQEYAKKYPDKLNASRKIWRDEQTANLTDFYIKALISRNNKEFYDFITPEIIELKRIQIKTFRLCQQLQN